MAFLSFRSDAAKALRSSAHLYSCTEGKSTWFKSAGTNRSTSDRSSQPFSASLSMEISRGLPAKMLVD